jgi:hypothetical protein
MSCSSFCDRQHCNPHRDPVTVGRYQLAIHPVAEDIQLHVFLLFYCLQCGYPHHVEQYDKLATCELYERNGVDGEEKTGFRVAAEICATCYTILAFGCKELGTT